MNRTTIKETKAFGLSPSIKKEGIVEDTAAMGVNRRSVMPESIAHL